MHREAAAERQHHAVDREAQEADETRATTARGIKDRGARQEEVRAVLRKVWARCTGLRAAEDHPAGTATPAKPRRGKEPAPALDVARVRTSVAARESEIAAKRRSARPSRRRSRGLEGARPPTWPRWLRGAPRRRSGRGRPREWAPRESRRTSGSRRTSVTPS